MEILVLGGTQWLGRELAREAIARGHAVTCLARGAGGGSLAPGARFVVADRSAPDAYDEVLDREWGAVIDVTRQPGFARAAATALAGRTQHLTFISSGNVYARHDEPAADESAELMPPLEADESTPETYGEAKSAIEQAYREAFDGRLLVIRPGLIGGPGDESGRTGYWVGRAARDDAPMLVPAIRDAATQFVDVRDLVGWAIDSIERGLTGAFNAVGDRSTFGAFLDASRATGGHRGEVVEATTEWLVEQEVAEWAGPESLPLWIAEPSWHAFADRSNAAARAEGFAPRPVAESLVDLLAWERSEGLDRPRRAGLTADRERDLVALLRPSSTAAEQHSPPR